MKSRSIMVEEVKKISECKTKEELKDILKYVRINMKNNRAFSFFLIKNKVVYNKIKEIYFYNNSIKESVYRLINDIDHEVKCKCGNICNFIDNNRGYRNFCGDKKWMSSNENR